MGRPRRFSMSFVRGQLEKLRQFRLISRNIQVGVVVEGPSFEEFPYQVSPSLAVGNIVSAWHSKTGIHISFPTPTTISS